MMNVDGFYHHEHLSIYRYALIFRGSAVILQSVAGSDLIEKSLVLGEVSDKWSRVWIFHM